MAGIVGIDRAGKRDLIVRMIEKMAYRGRGDLKLVENNSATLGAVWPGAQATPTSSILKEQAVWDARHPPLPSTLGWEREPFALAVAMPPGLFMARSPLGVRPLYYGQTDDGAICFASEVKALLEATRDVHEFPPGFGYSSRTGLQPFYKFEPQVTLDLEPAVIASGLRLGLEQAVRRRVDRDIMGSWLSGGLDSSVMAALARPHVHKLHTFAGGMPGAPDLGFARQVADFLDTEHHEIVFALDELLAALPLVIYHLESFDALLVRSTVVNYLVSQQATNYVGAVLSGEGGDELFAGYHYLKELEPSQLAQELADIVQRLHNTALQRVDRSASAHGLVAYVPFLDLNVVEYAQSIPPQLKLRRNGEMIEKWILRRAMAGLLPDEVLWRSKAKFWEGAGVGDLLAHYAGEKIGDAEFNRERVLPNGWTINTKEELMYYRIFREHFGNARDLSWMGRTKGAPQI